MKRLIALPLILVLSGAIAACEPGEGASPAIESPDLLTPDPFASPDDGLESPDDGLESPDDSPEMSPEES